MRNIFVKSIAWGGLAVLSYFLSLGVLAVIGSWMTSENRVTSTETTTPEQYYDANIQDVLIDSAELFWDTGDREGTVAMLRPAWDQVRRENQENAISFSNDPMLIRSELMLLNNLAYISRYLDPQEGIDLFWQMYQEPRYEAMGKALAMYQTMMYVAAKIDSGVISLDQAKEWVLAPEKFGGALGISQEEYNAIDTKREVRQYAVEGLRYASSLFDSNSLKQKNRADSVRLATQAELLVEEIYQRAQAQNITLEEIVAEDEVAQSAIQNLISESAIVVSTVEYMIANPIEWPYFQLEFLHGLKNIERVYNNLQMLGEDVYVDLLYVDTLVARYLVDHLKSDTPAVYNLSHINLAVSKLRVACGLYYVNPETEKIKQDVQNALQYFYNLDEENRRKLSLLQSTAVNPYDPCHDAFIAYGKEYDQLQDILVQEVGRWKDSQFVVE